MEHYKWFRLTVPGRRPVLTEASMLVSNSTASEPGTQEKPVLISGGVALLKTRSGRMILYINYRDGGPYTATYRSEVILDPEQRNPEEIYRAIGFHGLRRAVMRELGLEDDEVIL